MVLKKALLLSLLMLTTMSCSAQSKDDEFLWLEEIDSEQSMKWVDSQNHKTTEALAKTPAFESLYKRNLEILQSDEKIPFIFMYGDYYYNMLRDKTYSRGLLRRTTKEEYAKKNPKWEAVLDIDKLAEVENQSWFFDDITCLPPEDVKCLIQLSYGGGRALVSREFDMLEKKFVDDGFILAESWHSTSWIDENTIYVASDYGEGASTESDFPATVKRWKRGTAIEDAVSVFDTDLKHLGIFMGTTFANSKVVNYFTDYVDYHSGNVYVDSEGQWKKVSKPMTSSMVGIFHDYVLVQIKEAMTIDGDAVPAGSIVYEKLVHTLDKTSKFKVLAKSTNNKSISDVQITKNAIVVNWTKDVSSELSMFKLRDNDFHETSINLPKSGNIRIRKTQPFNHDFLVMYESFLTPDTIYRVNDTTDEVTTLKHQPLNFDVTKFETKQYFAESKDGTKVPYYLVISKEAKANGKNPTLIHAYGGFEISQMPTYHKTIGANWLEHGGAYVSANIRGGAEYGPKWHQAALKSNRHKAFEDFEAVTKDLIARNITQPRYLGIQGESNGGLLMGVMLTRSPQLFNAVISSVPLLDMLRYTKLSGGSSWIGEYGDPDIPEEREYLASYSPYHNIKTDLDYPEVLIHTTTNDDVVHPGHARKMAAKMQKMKHPVYFYELTEGGHDGTAEYKDVAFLQALKFSFLQQKLMKEIR